MKSLVQYIKEAKLSKKVTDPIYHILKYCEGNNLDVELEKSLKNAEDGDFYDLKNDPNKLDDASYAIIFGLSKDESFVATRKGDLDEWAIVLVKSVKNGTSKGQYMMSEKISDVIKGDDWKIWFSGEYDLDIETAIVENI